MSMLAFFPWLKLNKDDEEIDLEKVKLIPYIKGKLPGKGRNEVQLTCDKIFEPYIVSIIKPTEDSPTQLESINDCTILLLKDKELFQDYDEDEKTFLFSIAEIIAFSGISKREYFVGNLGFYCNRDDFTFIILGFRENPAGVQIATRRRDGKMTSYISEDVYKVLRPHNIKYGFLPVKFDIPLIKSLLIAQEKLDGENWSLFADAIFHFNRANTDSDQITQHQEVVLIISAFERLLDCNRGKENELVKKFLDTFKPEENLYITKSTRTKDSKSKNSNETLRERWMRDFFRLRGEYAHGKKTSKKNAIWKTHEHLLLGSYLFPLVVKCKLKKDGFYTLSEEDTCDINVFEGLANADLFTNTQKWNDIRWNSCFKQKLRKAAADGK